MPLAAVYVDGVRDLRKAFKEAEDADSLVELREGFKRAANVVAEAAQARMPSNSGRARGSVRATAGGNRAYVVGGRASVPYYGWLDFGSRRPRTGNPRSVGPWAGSGKGPPRGRFIYPAIDRNEERIVAIIEAALDDALDKLGL